MVQRTTPLLVACWLVATVFGSLTRVSAQDDLEQLLKTQQQRVATIAQARQATVAIFSPDGRGGGSGVLISSDGYAVTNYHVVKPCGAFMKCGLDDGQVYDAVIVGIDPTGDVALIKLDGRDDFPTAVLSDSDQVRLGQPCFAIGNPFLLATNLEPTVTWGLISGVHRYQYPAGTLLEYTDCLQTDASINPGNSGGPLFNERGEVIGINGRISLEKRGRVNVGVGYSISSNQVKYFLGHLKSGRIVDHATLGATVTTTDDGRVIISDVLASSDSFRRGLRYDDELLSFAGRTITTTNGFKNRLGIFPKGWTVPIEFRKDNERFETRVRLAGLHAEAELIEMLQAAPPTPGPRGPKGEAPEDEVPDDGAPPTETPAQGDGGTDDLFPDELKSQFEARRGYANYYFNRLNQDRLLDQFEDGNAVSTSEVWKITATDEAGESVELALGQSSSAWRRGDDIQLVDFESDLADQRLPDGSGGLLLAAYHWRQLITGQAKKVGSVTYLGTASLEDFSELDDVITATLQSVESQIYFNPTSHRVDRIETFADLSVDPCVIDFSDYRQIDGRWIPHRWTIREGVAPFMTLSIESIEVSTSAEGP